MQYTYIHTENYRLRLMGETEYNELFETRSPESIKEFLNISDESEWNMQLDKFREGFGCFGHHILFFHILKPDSEQAIGLCGFHNWAYKHRRAELAYILYDDAYKMKGIMSEVLARVIAYGFHEMDLHRICAMVAPYNVPSLRLLEKNGFTPEGMLRKDYFYKGKFEDSLVFSLLDEEYLQNKQAGSA